MTTYETYQLVRRRVCQDCGHRFHTIQPQERVIDDSQLHWPISGKKARMIVYQAKDDQKA